jgi:hypothetical protein
MIQYKGGDGSSKEQAIIILGAANETAGVDAEYDYLESKYGVFEIESQTYIGDKDKSYDVLNIKLADGIREEIWFDITNFYGKD